MEMPSSSGPTTRTMSDLGVLESENQTHEVRCARQLGLLDAANDVSRHFQRAPVGGRAELGMLGSPCPHKVAFGSESASALGLAPDSCCGRAGGIGALQLL